jgi:hypothetical protein
MRKGEEGRRIKKIGEEPDEKQGGRGLQMPEGRLRGRSPMVPCKGTCACPSLAFSLN